MITSYSILEGSNASSSMSAVPVPSESESLVTFATGSPIGIELTDEASTTTTKQVTENILI